MTIHHLISQLDWSSIYHSLNEKGYAHVPRFLTPKSPDRESI